MSWFQRPKKEPVSHLPTLLRQDANRLFLFKKATPKKEPVSYLPTFLRQDADVHKGGSRGSATPREESPRRSCWGTCCGPSSGVLEDNGIQPTFRRALLPYFADLCDEFRFEKLTLCVLPYERDWVLQYGETMFSASRCHTVVVKATFALVMLWGQWLSLFGWGSNAKYYGIYLTFWTLTVQNAYHICNLIMAIQASVGRTLPYTIQITTALRSIAEPCALIVTALYTLGTRFEDKSLSNIMVHGVNGVVVVLDAMVGRQTSRLFNNLWGFVYFAAYMAWTLVHYFLHIGDPSGNRCVYDGFCWEKPRVAIVNFLLIFCAVMPATSLFLWSLVWLRDAVISDTDRHRYLLANPAHDPRGGLRVSCQALCCILPLACLLFAFWVEKQCHFEVASTWSTGHIYACKHHGGPLESFLEGLLGVLKALGARVWGGLEHVQKEST